MVLVEVVLAAGVLAIAFLVYRVSEELRAMRCSVEALAECISHGTRIQFAGSSQHGHRGSPAKCFAIWMWGGTQWELDHGSIPPDADPGPPPPFAGSYHGQCVKTECR